MIRSDKKAKNLLKKVGFNDYNKFPNEMSIEEERRVCIARAMVNDHSIILLTNLQELSTLENKQFMNLLQN